MKLYENRRSHTLLPCKPEPTKAAGLDNAGSKWSREAQTKFVPRGLQQGSIINESQKHCKKRERSHFAERGGGRRSQMFTKAEGRIMLMI